MFEVMCCEILISFPGAVIWWTDMLWKGPSQYLDVSLRDKNKFNLRLFIHMHAL